MAYADDTKVSAEKTIAEISSLVRRNGGGQIAQLDGDDRFVMAFTMAERQIRFTVNLDAPQADRFAWRKTNATSREPRDAAGRQAAWEQQRRQRLRALLLVIKAKLESVESEVESFEQAFLANVVTSNGLTVHERISEDLRLEYHSGAVRPLMIGGPRG